MGDLVLKSNGINSYLLYELTEEDQLDKVSLAMLTHNHIDGLLSMQYRQMDASKQLMFDVSGKTCVSDLLQSILNPTALLRILRGIAVGLISAEEHRLLEKSLIITQECIFVDLKSFETSILCLPLMTLPEVEFSLRDTLREIVYHAKYNTENGSENIVKIINYLNSETHVDPVRFKEFLDECLAEKEEKVPHSPAHPHTPPAHEIAHDNQANPFIDNLTELTQTPVEVPAEPPKENKRLISFFGFGKKTDKSASKKEKKQKKSEKKKSANDADSLNFDFDFPGQDEMMVEVVDQSAMNKPTSEQPSVNKQPKHIDYGTTVLITDQDSRGGNAVGSMLCPHLIYRKTGEKVTINRDSFLIGRKETEVDYCIHMNKTVGRIHAEISCRDGEYFVKDLNSANHTYLNGKELPQMVEVPLTHGCSIVFSDEEFEFRMI